MHDLFGWPYLSWLFLPFGLIALRRSREGWLLFGIFPSLVFVYLFYWIGSWLLGPRYYYEALPGLAITSAAGVVWLGGWMGSRASGMVGRAPAGGRGHGLFWCWWRSTSSSTCPSAWADCTGCTVSRERRCSPSKSADLGRALVIVHPVALLDRVRLAAHPDASLCRERSAPGLLARSRGGCPPGPSLRGSACVPLLPGPTSKLLRLPTLTQRRLSAARLAVQGDSGPRVLRAPVVCGARLRLRRPCYIILVMTCNPDRRRRCHGARDSGAQPPGRGVRGGPGGGRRGGPAPGARTEARLWSCWM